MLFSIVDCRLPIVDTPFDVSLLRLRSQSKIGNRQLAMTQGRSQPG
jgi:hypothetical protein